MDVFKKIKDGDYYLKKNFCKCCKRMINPVVGEIWVNCIDFRVRILDVGLNEVWVEYMSNYNHCAWLIRDFLKSYKKEK